jgi:hypothetical protein
MLNTPAAAISSTLEILVSKSDEDAGSIAHAKKVVDSLLDGIQVMRDDIKAMNVMQLGAMFSMVLMGGYMMVFWTRQRKGRMK